MLSATHEQKILGLVGGLTLLVMAIVAGIVYPTVVYINKINQDTLNLRMYLEKRYETVHKLHTSLEQVKTIKETVSNFNQYLFFAGDELKLITDLENLAIRHGVTQKIDSTNLDQAKKQQIIVALTLNGGYQNILNYLSDLEGAEYFWNVTRFHWAAAGNAPSDFTEARLELSLYVNQ